MARFDSPTPRPAQKSAHSHARTPLPQTAKHQDRERCGNSIPQIPNQQRRRLEPLPPAAHCERARGRGPADVCVACGQQQRERQLGRAPDERVAHPALGLGRGGAGAARGTQQRAQPEDYAEVDKVEEEEEGEQQRRPAQDGAKVAPDPARLKERSTQSRRGMRVQSPPRGQPPPSQRRGRARVCPTSRRRPSAARERRGRRWRPRR